jgi:hypothetical protein
LSAKLLIFFEKALSKTGKSKDFAYFETVFADFESGVCHGLQDCRTFLHEVL